MPNLKWNIDMAKTNSNSRLTDLSIRKMKPLDNLIDSGEYSGLRVDKSKTGITSYLYRYRSPIDNKIKQYTFGYYPEMSLSVARVEFQTLKAKRKSGVCIATEAKAERERLKFEASIVKSKDRVKQFTVEDLVENYLSNYIEDLRARDGSLIRKGARKPKGAYETRRTLSTDVLNLLGKYPAAEIDHKHIVDMIVSIVNRGANVQAGNVLRELTAAYDFSIDLLPDDFPNPCLQANNILKRKKFKLTSSKRSRFFSDSEISTFLKWLPDSKFTLPHINIFRLTLMTGCRTGEACNAEWKDFDLTRAVWFLTENKSDSPRHIQLSKQTVEFLSSMGSKDTSYLFPNKRNGMPVKQKQLTERSWYIRTNGYPWPINNWAPHDLRRTVRTGLARLGCPNEVGEAVLGHEQGGIISTYNIHNYESECRLWLQRWCDHLDEVMNNE